MKDLTNTIDFFGGQKKILLINLIKGFIGFSSTSKPNRTHGVRSVWSSKFLNQRPTTVEIGLGLWKPHQPYPNLTRLQGPSTCTSLTVPAQQQRFGPRHEKLVKLSIDSSAGAWTGRTACRVRAVTGSVARFGPTCTWYGKWAFYCGPCGPERKIRHLWLAHLSEATSDNINPCVWRHLWIVISVLWENILVNFCIYIKI